MRFLLAFLGLTVVAFGGDRAVELEKLKQDFPSHIAGLVTDKSDPAVQVCFNKYRARVLDLTLENLGTELYQIQDAANREFRYIERRLKNERNVLTSAGRHAEEQNVAWLKQKLIPYLKRLVQFQRGR